MVADAPDQARTLACTMLQLAERERLSIWLATGQMYQGWSAAVTSRDERALPVIDDGLARWRSTGARLWLPVYLALRAEALSVLDRRRAAAEALAAARELVGQTPDRHYAGEVHRRWAALHLATGEQAEPERALALACDVAAEQSARLYHLRNAGDLARLWADGGARQRARDLLAPVYNSFTEGFDTPDPVDAEAPLEALR